MIRKAVKRRNREEQQPKNNKQNGKKYITIKNYFKCKWTKLSNQKT